jgi:hypothetical protein
MVDVVTIFLIVTVVIKKAKLLADGHGYNLSWQVENRSPASTRGYDKAVVMIDGG